MGSGSMSVKDKWTKTKWLMADRGLRQYVPETRNFSRSALEEMLERYAMVYFKPKDGTGGNGIARVKRKSGEAYSIKKSTRTFTVSSLQSLYNELEAMAKDRSYLLQKGIHLKKSDGRPFDIRVMVQNTAQGRWVPTVSFVKLGRPNKIATNYHQGGTLALLGTTLRRAGYNSSQIADYRRQLNELGRQTARCFERRSAKFKELGLDVALDREGRLWILEVNTRPNFYAIQTLTDKSLYRTILRYGKQYGRTK